MNSNKMSAKSLILGFKVVLVDRGVHDSADEILTDAGIMVIQRVSTKDMRRVAEHSGARMMKRTGLKKEYSRSAKNI